MSRKKKSLSKVLSRHDLEDDEFVAAAVEIHHGSDRVAAIMGSALIEESLLRAIKASLANPEDESALFYDQGAPFGTFRSRIVAGKALGLYDDALAHDLDMIRDIRNQFAHALLAIDFANIHIAQACACLRKYHGEGTTSPLSGKKAEARNSYEAACWTIGGILLDRANARLEASLKRTNSERRSLHRSITAGLQRGPNDLLRNDDAD